MTIFIPYDYDYFMNYYMSLERAGWVLSAKTPLGIVMSYMYA